MFKENNGADMEYSIQKRDGRYANFEYDKINKAISKSFRAVGKKDELLCSKLTKEVVKILQKDFFDFNVVPTVEEVQDLVEQILIENKEAQAAKAYIIYREKRAEMRDIKKNFLDGVRIIDEYLNQRDWRVKENSNMSYSLQGLNLHISSQIVSRYWLRKLYPLDVRMAHEEGDIHIHDLGILGPYCVGWDLPDLLEFGFTGVAGKVESKPPKHFRTALGQIVNFFYTLQGEAAGAQAFSSFDTLLAPFVRYDKLSYKEVKQCMQEFIFNLNVPTRVGFQTPFTNITLDLEPSGNLKDLPVIVGGKRQKEKYADFQKEMDMINKSFAEIMMEGDAKGRIFTFPIPTYNITKDFNWENKNWEPIWEMTAKYGIPNFANFIDSNLSPDDVRSMCCRLRLDTRKLNKKAGGLFGSSPLTGSLGVVTINLPRIGYRAENREEFFNLLSRAMEVSVEALEIKRKNVERLTEQGLYPFTKFYLRNLKKADNKYWGRHFSTIGIVGMNEALMNFMDKNIVDEEGRNFALEVLDFMRAKILDIQSDTGNLYNLEATPAESTAYRLARKDRAKHTDIYCSGQCEPYYTNSVHPPVEKFSDIYDLLSHQDELQCKFTGGTMVHLFLGEDVKDWNLVRNLVKKIANKFSLPYFTLTPTFSISPVSGYLSGKHYFDPNPQKKEDLEKLGAEFVLSEEQLKELPKGSYLIIDENHKEEIL